MKHANDQHALSRRVEISLIVNLIRPRQTYSRADSLKAEHNLTLIRSAIRSLLLPKLLFTKKFHCQTIFRIVKQLWMNNIQKKQSEKNKTCSLDEASVQLLEDWGALITNWELPLIRPTSSKYLSQSTERLMANQRKLRSSLSKNYCSCYYDR